MGLCGGDTKLEFGYFEYALVGSEDIYMRIEKANYQRQVGEPS